MRNVLRMTIVLLTFAASASAQQRLKASGSKEKDPCASAMTQYDINQCTLKEYHKAEAHLNAIYAKLLALMGQDFARARQRNDSELETFDKTALRKLREVQGIWLQYRSHECGAAEQQIDGGSMSPAVWAECMTEVTNDRIKELKHDYETPDRTLNEAN
ncbi:MAG TPA: lysozyme inhibitor LprI family protein [Candidatus Dormibacteraeota bacterium]|nr:lysozyme inhibitor LprI family protein [Candidatus Dormibacteraeota bacterium]